MSDESGLWLLLAGPGSAAAVYWGLYRFYRNTDKSHGFERETHVEAQPVTGNDTLFGKVTGTQATRIQGDNVGAYRARVQRVASAVADPDVPDRPDAAP
jgi:hypothetical protein